MFFNKISEGVGKPTTKLVQDAACGISRRKSCLLSNIARDLKEKVKVLNTINRLSNRLYIVIQMKRKKL